MTAPLADEPRLKHEVRDGYPSAIDRALKRDVSADGGESLFGAWSGCGPISGRPTGATCKLRVLIAMVLLLAAKLATIAVPFTFKWATDALTGQGSAPVAPVAWLAWVLAAPIVMTIAYGGMRILMAVLTQMRDGMFAKVAMNAVRRLAYRTFEHMHRLSLRFHLERKTGGLTRVLERGRNAIETIVRMVIMQLVPTIIELALIVGRAALPVRLALRRGHPRSPSRSTWCSPIRRPSGASASAAA